MKSRSLARLLTLAAAVISLVGCSGGATKSPDVTDSVRKALDQANLHDVKVSQDRDKGVVTLTGQVAADADKAQAESITKSIAGSQVVADEIAVVPPGPGSSDAKTVNSDLDRDRVGQAGPESQRRRLERQVHQRQEAQRLQS